ncbi:MAG TPA: hypothetical protein DHV36_19665 [Desulfobacteraceae bacterium]|nr:hypothetical protein [Desulfobacteraceae bacterium]
MCQVSHLLTAEQSAEVADKHQHGGPVQPQAAKGNIAAVFIHHHGPAQFIYRYILHIGLPFLNLPFRHPDPFEIFLVSGMVSQSDDENKLSYRKSRFNQGNEGMKKIFRS